MRTNLKIIKKNRKLDEKSCIFVEIKLLWKKT